MNGMRQFPRRNRLSPPGAVAVSRGEDGSFSHIPEPRVLFPDQAGAAAGEPVRMRARSYFLRRQGRQGRKARRLRLPADSAYKQTLTQTLFGAKMAPNVSGNPFPSVPRSPAPFAPRSVPGDPAPGVPPCCAVSRGIAVRVRVLYPRRSSRGAGLRSGRKRRKRTVTAPGRVSGMLVYSYTLEVVTIIKALILVLISATHFLNMVLNLIAVRWDTQIGHPERVPSDRHSAVLSGIAGAVFLLIGGALAWMSRRKGARA